MWHRYFWFFSRFAVYAKHGRVITFTWHDSEMSFKKMNSALFLDGKFILHKITNYIISHYHISDFVIFYQAPVAGVFFSFASVIGLACSVLIIDRQSEPGINDWFNYYYIYNCFLNQLSICIKKTTSNVFVILVPPNLASIRNAQTVPFLVIPISQWTSIKRIMKPWENIKVGIDQINQKNRAEKKWGLYLSDKRRKRTNKNHSNWIAITKFRRKVSYLLILNSYIDRYFESQYIKIISVTSLYLYIKRYCTALWLSTICNQQCPRTRHCK